MERYFVDYKLHNAENGGWAYKTELSTGNKDEALKKYHSVCSQYIGSVFDHVLITMSDAFGNILQKEVWDAPIPEPQPEPDTETEEVTE